MSSYIDLYYNLARINTDSATNGRNWDTDVREDMSDALDRLAPEDKKGNLYRHSAEGLDDMPVSSASFSAIM